MRLRYFLDTSVGHMLKSEKEDTSMVIGTELKVFPFLLILSFCHYWLMFMFITANICVIRITGQLEREGGVKLWDFCTWPQYSKTFYFLCDILRGEGQIYYFQ